MMVTVVQVMEEVGVRRVVFSSSATVYGVPEYLPLDEKHRTGAYKSFFFKTYNFSLVCEECVCLQGTARTRTGRRSTRWRG